MSEFDPTPFFPPQITLDKGAGFNSPQCKIGTHQRSG